MVPIWDAEAQAEDNVRTEYTSAFIYARKISIGVGMVACTGVSGGYFHVSNAIYWADIR